jgi:hypothetical protein
MRWIPVAKLAALLRQFDATSSSPDDPLWKLVHRGRAQNGSQIDGTAFADTKAKLAPIAQALRLEAKIIPFSAYRSPKGYKSWHISRVLALQNDGDEWMSARALRHLRLCAPKASRSYPLAAPALFFRHNFWWLQRPTFSRKGALFSGDKCLEGGGARPTGLLKHMWAQGPIVWPLGVMLAHGNTMRHVGRAVNGDPYRRIHCVNHLGVGSGVHLSSVAEPGERWLKQHSVVEGSGLLRDSYPQALLDALRQAAQAQRGGGGSALRSRAWLAELVFNASVAKPPQCNGNESAVQWWGDLTALERDVVRRSIPWAVRLNPLRYPFLLPGAAGGATSGSFARLASKAWADCSANAPHSSRG